MFDNFTSDSREDFREGVPRTPRNISGYKRALGAGIGALSLGALGGLASFIGNPTEYLSDGFQFSDIDTLLQDEIFYECLGAGAIFGGTFGALAPKVFYNGLSKGIRKRFYSGFEGALIGTGIGMLVDYDGTAPMEYGMFGAGAGFISNIPLISKSIGFARSVNITSLAFNDVDEAPTSNLVRIKQRIEGLR